MWNEIYAGDIEEIARIQGEMAEWTKAHDSKSCGPQGPGGSNPSLSACKTPVKAAEAFFVFSSMEGVRDL